MRRRFIAGGMGLGLVVLIGVLGTGPSLAEDPLCNPDGTIENPEPFTWTDAGDHFVGTLEYGEATFTVDGESLTTRAYRQEGKCYSIPGPTLNMQPGEKYVLRFHNLLPYEAPSETHNDFKDPNVTNLHTHGLHISGEGAGDDVTRMFEGGYGGDYVYDIPTDHMGGTFWYHAHHHGSTFLQVSTGGFGLIVIDDGADGIPANVAAMEERHVVIGYLDTGAAGTGGDTLVSGTLAPGWTVNGNRNGVMAVPPNTWQHWRVLLADRDARMKDVTVGAGCEVALLARDGVWRTVAPKMLPDNSITLTGASRADLAVRCSDPSNIMVDNTEVASIAIDGSSDTTPHPFAADGESSWSTARPTYLRDLRDLPQTTDVNTETVRMGARTINGSKFELNTPTLSLPANAVQDWSVKGATNHPFHLHVYHFQAQDDCSGGVFEPGEYYDTLATSCTIRFDLNDATSSVYEGRTIMHCHILDHEDQGAMGWLDVEGGTPPPSYPTGDYSLYYSLDTGSTTTTSSSTTTTTTTTTTAPTGTAIVLDHVMVSVVNIGAGQKVGEAMVGVVDDVGNPVEEATVTGTFSGTFNETKTSATDTGGMTVIQTTDSAKGNVSVTFCVTEITHPGLNDWTGSVCASS